MREAIAVTLDAWQKYWGNGFYEYLLAVAGLYFLIFGRKKQKAKELLLYVAVVLIIFFCPVTAWIIQKCVGGSVYWRVLWILPMTPLIAYGGTCLIKKAGEKKGLSAVFLAGMIAVLALGGVGLNMPGYYEKVHNYQKIPDEFAQICEVINNQKEEDEIVYLASDDKVSSYVRVYDPSIRMPYGRAGRGSINKTAKALHEQLVAEVPVIKKVVKYAKKLECTYLVFPLPNEKKQEYMEKKGYHLISQVNSYGIFKYYE